MKITPRHAALAAVAIGLALIFAATLIPSINLLGATVFTAFALLFAREYNLDHTTILTVINEAEERATHAADLDIQTLNQDVIRLKEELAKTRQIAEEASSIQKFTNTSALGNTFR